MKISTKIKGKFTEGIASLLLILQGYKIISNNHHLRVKGTGAGEVDIICRKENLIVFVEVKYRNTMEEAMYAISNNQKERISRAVEAFFFNHPTKYADCETRVDAMLFAPYKMPKHIKNAW
ncbi:MAG: YraN family protein [Alphaproteobacteria bacterium]|nr:YraN family protein [Alphaproteobacteria bacterium]